MIFFIVRAQTVPFSGCKTVPESSKSSAYRKVLPMYDYLQPRGKGGPVHARIRLRDKRRRPVRSAQQMVCDREWHRNARRNDADRSDDLFTKRPARQGRYRVDGKFTRGTFALSRS